MKHDQLSGVEEKLRSSLFIFHDERKAVMSSTLFNEVPKWAPLHATLKKALQVAEKEGRVLWALQEPEKEASVLQKINHLLKRNGLAQLPSNVSPIVVLDTDAMREHLMKRNPHLHIFG